jgi:hypothetical protein
MSSEKKYFFSIDIRLQIYYTFYIMNFIDEVKNNFPNQTQFSRTELWSVASNPSFSKFKFRKQFTEFMTNPANKISRGLYRIGDGNIQGNIQAVPKLPKVKIKQELQLHDTVPKKISELNLVPEKDSSFVPFGEFNRLKKIIYSKMFFPVYISGESGNGKTKMVEQACSANNREMIRVNITSLTDEDDLIGGYRLVNGETVFQEGPIIEAMKRGAVVLLDEINLGTPQIMCLQPVMEGNSIYIKKTNTLVSPKKGFNIIATGNTKGNSMASDGRYIGSKVLNEAMLDRFAINIEHEYPSETVERKILLKSIAKFDIQNTDELTEYGNFIEILIKWAKNIRETFAVGGTEDIITTRRLKQIVEFYIIDKTSRIQSIKSCTTRFNNETKESFITLYRRLDETASVDPLPTPNTVPTNDLEYLPPPNY